MAVLDLSPPAPEPEPHPARAPADVGPPTAVIDPEFHAPPAALRAEPAPSSNLALAARRFGDRFPERRPQTVLRLLGALTLVLMAWYLPWMFTHLAGAPAWLGWPFAAASVLSAICVSLSVINGWRSEITAAAPLTGDGVPDVVVLIPTLGEPVGMVMRTVISVLEQDFPRERLHVIVSDDGGSPALAAAVATLGVDYFTPPPRDHPSRGGAAKAGNLNAALAEARRRFPGVRYVETRDCDDEVGSDRFLRHTLGLLEADPGLAYVQTIKEAQVSAGDPFCNLDSQFYRSQMLSRNAANAVFPCGSGLVWRDAALSDIGDFPTWNLVEDFQSGVEALRRGWRGRYLTIVGAVGQHSPEDVANVVKQRGTWAIDSVRLLVWGRRRGLTLRQRLQFSETLYFYLHALAQFVYVPLAGLAFVGLLPIDASPLSCVLHLMPYAVASEVRLLVLNEPFADRRTRRRRPLRALWYLKLMWLGLAPVYALGVVKAILNGPRRKPIYRVTRKTNHVAWHWRETVPQAVLAVLPLVGLIVGLATGRLPSPLIIITAAYWGLVSSMSLAGFVALGWFGTSPVEALRTVERRRARTRRPATAALAPPVAAPGPDPIPEPAPSS